MANLRIIILYFSIKYIPSCELKFLYIKYKDFSLNIKFFVDSHVYLILTSSNKYLYILILFKNVSMIKLLFFDKYL